MTPRYTTMNWIRKKVHSEQVLAGTFLNLGAGCVAEMAGRAGLDWVLIDMEHGLGDELALVSYLQAARVGGVAAIVRVASNRCEYFKRALDLGAVGIMTPQVNTAEEAQYAVSCMKYPPEGIRGMTRTSWASGFGYEAEGYIAAANENVLAVIQIETCQAVENADAIAAVKGVDVLFVGPSDLSCNAGLPCDLNHPKLKAYIGQVRQAAEKYGKRTGILIKDSGQLASVIADGFNLIALETNISLIKTGLKSVVESFNAYKNRSGM